MDEHIGAPSLERSSRTGDWTLDGQGVELLPSAPWTGAPLFAGHPPEAGGYALIYAARATALRRTWP